MVTAPLLSVITRCYPNVPQKQTMYLTQNFFFKSDLKFLRLALSNIHTYKLFSFINRYIVQIILYSLFQKPQQRFFRNLSLLLNIFLTPNLPKINPIPVVPRHQSRIFETLSRSYIILFQKKSKKPMKHTLKIIH